MRRESNYLSSVDIATDLGCSVDHALDLMYTLPGAVNIGLGRPGRRLKRMLRVPRHVYRAYLERAQRFPGGPQSL